MEIDPREQAFEQARPMLYGIAYRMLGSFSDAEDIVQDAWFRWRKVELKKVESPRAYLASTVSRLCIDQHRKNKTHRLNYTGPWLPEPIDEETLAMMDSSRRQHRKGRIGIYGLPAALAITNRTRTGGFYP